VSSRTPKNQATITSRSNKRNSYRRKNRSLSPRGSRQAKPPKEKEPKPSKTARPEQEQPSQQEGAKRSHEEHGQSAAQAPHGRPTGKGGHIPDDKFRASFGRQHPFVISRPVIVENRPRFQSGGFWFEIVDPWPTVWAYTDDCYIDYIDGEYFLFDLLHPGVRIAVFVVE
jgi:hypothetical protein